MEDGLVDVIVPVYNTEKFIRRCLDSILNQTYENLEVIVVYDPSPDNSLKVLEEYKGKIRLIKRDKKTNVSVARNVGLKHSRGEFVAFLESDDFYLASDKIEKQVEVLNKEPKIGLVYTDMIELDEEGNEIRRIEVPDWDEKSRRLFPYLNFIPSSAIVIRKSFLKEVGGFDESLFCCEDLDIFLKLSKITEFKKVKGFMTAYTTRSEGLGSNYYLIDQFRLKVLRKHKLLIPCLIMSLALLRDRILVKNTMSGKLYFRFLGLLAKVSKGRIKYLAERERQLIIEATRMQESNSHHKGCSVRKSSHGKE